MSAPKRIQMSRQKPWRAEHPDAVIVDRRTGWGNPVTLKRYKHMTMVGIPHADFVERYLAHADAVARAVEWFREQVAPTLDLEPLRGRDLACWCPLPAEGELDVCHAAVLLELANQTDDERNKP